MSTTDTSLALHPFFLAGMGEGPYRFTGCYDLGEAMNPNTAANFGNMRGWAADAPKLKAGLGTCACCGMGISIICIIKNAAGELYGVGSDCVEKTDNEGICRKGVKAALALRNRAKRQAKAAAKRKAEWEAGREAREEHNRNAAARELAEQRERYAIAERNRPLIDLLYGDAWTACTGRREPDGSGWGAHVWLDNWNRWFCGSFNGGFRASILADLLNGTPAPQLSHRVRSILCDIYAKQHGGRAGSKAYEIAYDHASHAIDDAK